MNIHIPTDVGFIIDKLIEYGYEAFAVGGCVRDSILGREPDDWDITTSAAPHEIKGIFGRTIDTGIQHGTVTILIGKIGYEVTTYRIDGDYEDSRHPRTVEFTANLVEDLKRRDFTMNAMAYNQHTGLIDQFDGMRDLEHNVIRCVGNPKDRLEEDALRILRAVRFSAQLGFQIEEDTWQAVKDSAPNLLNISKERIQVELTKLLVSKHPEYFSRLFEAGITSFLMPEFDAMMAMPQNNRAHCFGVGEHTIKMLEHIPGDKILRWTALLHDIGKIHTKAMRGDGSDYFPNHALVSERMAKDILKDLKMDNRTIVEVSQLIHWHSYPFKMNKISVRRALSKIGAETFPNLLLVMRADTMAKNCDIRALRLEQIDQVEAYYREIIESGDCINLKMLAVDGKDLIKAGVSEGKAIGETLYRLLSIVLKQPELNTKTELLKRI